MWYSITLCDIACYIMELAHLNKVWKAGKTKTKHSFVDIRWTWKPKNRCFKNWLRCWLTKNSSKIEKRSCQLYASRTTKLRTQMSSWSTEQSKAAKWSHFCENVRASPPFWNRREMCIWNSGLAPSFHKPTIVSTALFWETREFYSFESGGLNLN